MFQLVALIACAIVLVSGAAYTLLQRQFLRAHHARYRAFISDDERWDLLEQGPRRFAEGLSSDTGGRLSAMFAAVDDPEVERLRRRALVALYVAGASVVLSVPVGLILSSAIARAARGMGLDILWVGVAGAIFLTLFWSRLAWRYRRGPGRAARIVSLGGTATGVGLLVVMVALVARG